MLILSRGEVEALLDLDGLVDALAGAMADLSAGRASMPPRVAAMADQGGLLGVMPAYLPSAGALTTKLVTLFPRNAGTGLPTHQAVVAAFDPSTGEPLALMDGTSITAIRTAAGSALSTRILARPDAAILAVIGTGVQAQSHLRAIPRVRPIREIRMAGRSADAVRALASRMAEELEVPVRPTDSLEEAMHGADVVCACTHSPEPVVRRQWLSPGAHVTSVGMTPEGREVDGPTVADALVVVEQRSAAFAPFPTGSNDLAFALRDGLIGEDHIHAEIGELVTGAKPGRTDRDRITLYKSVGVAVQDAAAAALVLEAARNRGTGTEVIV